MSIPLGQLLLLEASNADWSSGLERLLHRSKPAGVSFKALATIPATWETARKCASVLGSVPFLALHDEGEGALCSLFGASLQPARLAGVPAEAIEMLGELVGRAMQIAGLNLNLAPTVDLQSEFSSVVSRSILDSSPPHPRPLSPKGARGEQDSRDQLNKVSPRPLGGEGPGVRGRTPVVVNNYVGQHAS